MTDLFPGASDSEQWDLWTLNGGREQSSGFMQSLLAACDKAYLPFDTFRSAIDIGCALGDGTVLLRERMPQDVWIAGIDISLDGIVRCERHWAAANVCWMLVDPNTPLTMTADFITCSNVLEHLDNPMKHLERWLGSADVALAVLVPFEQQMIDGIIHKHDFTFSDFPCRLAGHSLISLKAIEVPHYCWIEPQLFALYMRLEKT